MARFRKVDPRIWGDAKFRRLSPIPPCGQGLWLYLLTCPEATSLPGLIVAGEAGLAEALGWSLEAFRKAFAEAFREGLVRADWSARVVWVKNAPRYNVPESPNVVRSWRDHWDNVPECQLKREAYQWLKAFVEGLAEGFQKAFAEACSEPNTVGAVDPSPNQEQEQEQEQDLFCRPEGPTPEHQVFDFWAESMSHRGAKFDRKRRARIRARLSEGRTPEDLCKAIRGALLDDWLMGRDKQSTKRFDGIETIFRDAAQVERLIDLYERGGKTAASTAVDRIDL